MIDVAIPKLRQGSYFPDWLLTRRKPAERALTSVVATGSAVLAVAAVTRPSRAAVVWSRMIAMSGSVIIGGERAAQDVSR